MTVVTPDGDETPVTFAAFAVLIGKSRPYVSALVAKGIICAPALTPERLIIPSLAIAQIAAAATRPKADAAEPAAPGTSATLNTERQRLTTAQANRVELENQVRRGELIPRTALAAALPPLARRYVDRLRQAIRDTVTDDVERATLLDRLDAETESFITKAQTDGGELPPD